MTDQRPCPFCEPPGDRIAFEEPLAFGLWDAFPATPGHLLLVPRRHIPTWFEATEEEQSALVKAIDKAKAVIEGRYRPDGFNIGINVGKAGGQTVFHLHVHVIPRYLGDVPDPRGGVRHVIPGQGNYLGGGLPPGTGDERSRLVKGGDDDPLLPSLIEHFAEAQYADLAVAFVLPSGLDRLERHLSDLLDRKGRLRIVTGDYLDVTDPDALTRLLDFQGDRDIRVFETQRDPGPALPAPLPPLTFHPKAYLFRKADGTGVAFVGSSNLTAPALTTGLEWNYRVVSSREGGAFEDVLRAFEQLFAHRATRPLDEAWIEAYRRRRHVPVRMARQPVPLEVEQEPAIPATPHSVQVEALAALEATRKKGYEAGLVVLATGLGKTCLSAFDTNRPEYRRILFVAHREEILTQARNTFRRIRPQAHLGFYKGGERAPEADVLFASIQTLGRVAHLERFGRSAFDYIVVDEFHHASAPTYRRLIDYFQPKFLLGLTATPERTDGGPLLSLCDENLVYRCDLVEGIRRDLLSRLRYFGVPDEVDYRNIPWRNARFDEVELTRHVATQARAQNALEQLEAHGGTRALAFCVSQRHADFMADFFRQHGKRAVAVHAGDTSAPRAKSLEELAAGHLDVICAVDVFNEGLDLPDLDTVLMLRPTESRIVWLQQLGRGLRRTDEHKVLRVIDYIGNHRTFLVKALTLFALQPGEGPEDPQARLLNLLEEARRGPIAIAPGCEVTYDLRAIDILRGLIRTTANRQDALRRYYQEFVELHGTRPRAAEAVHDGYNPRAFRRDLGSWLGFVKSVGGMAPAQASAYEHHAPFLDALETTEMTKSYKMLVLQAMLNEGQFPGEIPIEQLAEAVTRVASRSAVLRKDVGPSLDQPEALRNHLEKNPIDAWTGARGTGGATYFAYDNGVFRTTFATEEPEREAIQELTRELVDWRLAEYLQRLESQSEGETSYLCKVSHANGRPILFLPDRASNPGMPEGPTPVEIDGKPFEADFVKVAVNVLHRPGETDNRLAEVLRGWFGPDAGLPGTRHEVVVERPEGHWKIRPLRRLGNTP